jgi:hypothetical protein
MTIAAVLLGRQFYDLNPGPRLKYATLGLLFVNVSVGGTLTHFAAPPVLMVARHWDWDTVFMATPHRLARGAGDRGGHLRLFRALPRRVAGTVAPAAGHTARAG